MPDRPAVAPRATRLVGRSGRADDAAGRSARAAWRRARRRALVQAVGWVVVVGLAAWAAAGVAWGPPVADPVALSAAVGGVALGRWWVGRVDAGRWARGADGEVATAALLCGLGRRYVVRHDLAVPVPTSEANIDHLVIGRTGCWVIDTKARRGRLTRRWRSVRANGTPIATSSVAWQAEVLAERLAGAGLPWAAAAVRPLVAVHGDGLGRRGGRVEGVPVVPAAALVARIRRRRGSARLSRTQVRTLAAACDALVAPAGAGRQTAALRGGR